MKLVWSEKSWEDYLYWQSHDKKMVKKINSLIKDIKREPFDGLGKPEPLRYALAGCWSRRITDEHRVVYEVDDESIYIVSCRFHYS